MSIKVVQNYTINDIKDGIRYLLEKASYEPGVREFALQLSGAEPDMISPIYGWIRQNVNYVSDPIDVELFTSPIRMISDYQDGKLLAEDCDGMAMLATALYRSLGIESNVVLLDTGGGGIDHAISQVKSDQLGWINVDVSDKTHPLGWEIPYYSRLIV